MSFTTLRSALYINNSGVGLLEHGHFREAQKTFREALILMKQVIKKKQQSSASSSCSSEDEEEALEEETRRLLQNVSTRLVRAQAKPIFTVFDIRAMEDSGDGDDDDDDDCLSSIKSALQYGPSSSLVFPIRIRSSQQQQDYNNNSLQSRRLAIILYNQALSHSLWAQSPEVLLQQQSSSSSSLHFYGALSSLKVAHSVLSRHLSRIIKNDTDIITSSSLHGRQAAGCMLLHALVVNNLIQVLQAAAAKMTSRLHDHAAQDEQKEERQPGQEQQCGGSSLQDWIQLRDQLLLECNDLMDNAAAENDDHNHVAAAAATAARRGQTVQCAAAA
jgi:hypothetical protein